MRRITRQKIVNNRMRVLRCFNKWRVSNLKQKSNEEDRIKLEVPSKEGENAEKFRQIMTKYAQKRLT